MTFHLLPLGLGPCPCFRPSLVSYTLCTSASNSIAITCCHSFQHAGSAITCSSGGVFKELHILLNQAIEICVCSSSLIAAIFIHHHNFVYVCVLHLDFERYFDWLLSLLLLGKRNK